MHKGLRPQGQTTDIRSPARFSGVYLGRGQWLMVGALVGVVLLAPLLLAIALSRFSTNLLGLAKAEY